MIVIGIRFKKAGKTYYFDPLDIDVHKNDKVIVETSRGLEFGTVITEKKEVVDDELIHPVKPILRVATQEDIDTNEENKIKEQEAKKICLEKISQHNLDMYLTDVEYTFDNNKVIFYFTAEGRVDFRELVKDLAAVFRTRIELRQIGVRDEAKVLNGIGPCGKQLCCATWMGDFNPVSIKMAKDQNLSLNPTKISGVCSRLMCCLNFEHQTYLEYRKGMPDQGDKVRTPEGKGDVLDVNILGEKVLVKVNRKEGDIESWFPKSEVKILQKGRKDKQQNGGEDLGDLS